VRKRVPHTSRRGHPNTKMTGKYVELNDSREALAYVYSVLEDGNVIASAVSKTLSAGASIHAFVPFGVSSASLPAFTHGGVCTTNESRDALVGQIEQHLSRGSEKVVLFEDILARPDDAWLCTSKLRVVCYESEVYYSLLAEDIGTEMIARTVARGFSGRHKVAVFSDAPSLTLTPPNRFATADVNAIAGRTSKVAVGAFDGESFLLLETAARKPGTDET
jgi:hypothetical protein